LQTEFRTVDFSGDSQIGSASEGGIPPSWIEKALTTESTEFTEETFYRCADTSRIAKFLGNRLSLGW